MALTDPRRVVGLKYEAGDGAPRVILKASGELVEAVLSSRMRAARAAPVIRNDALLDELYRLPVDGRIGPELYKAVAILLAHVFAVDAKLKGETHV